MTRKKEILFKKFKSKKSMEDYILENADNLHRYQLSYVLNSLNEMKEGQYSLYDVLKSGVERERFPQLQNNTKYEPILKDLQMQIACCELKGETKKATNLIGRKWDVMNSANDDNFNEYYKKYYSNGYKFLEKILKSIENDDQLCYNAIINKFCENEEIGSIIRILDILLEVNSLFRLMMEDNFANEESIALPRINGMIVGAYNKREYNIWDEIKDFTTNAYKTSKKFIEKSMKNYNEAQETKREVESKARKEIVGKTYDLGNELKNKIEEASSSIAKKGLDIYHKITGREFARNLSEDINNYDKNNTNVDKVIDAHYFSGYKGTPVIKNNISDTVEAAKTFKDSFEKNMDDKSKLYLGNKFTPIYDVDNAVIWSSAANATMDALKEFKDSKKDLHFDTLIEGTAHGTFGISNLIFLDNAYYSKLDENGNDRGSNKEFKDKYTQTLNHEWGHNQQYNNMGPLFYVKDVAIPSMSNMNSASKLDYDEYYLQPWELGADVLGGVTGRTFADDVNVDEKEKVGMEKIYTPYVIINSILEKINSWN